MAQEIIGSDKSDVELKNGNDSELESIYGTLRPISDQSKGEKLNGKGPNLNGDKENNSNGLNQESVDGHETFVYKTMNGGVVRSVHPPGKGATTYKVSWLSVCVCGGFSVWF